MANVFFAISQPTSAISELGPGTPSPPQNPIGSGIVVATSTTAGAQIELRVNVTAGSQNAQNALTAAQIIKALCRYIWFFRQRGFISGSGGPTTTANFNIP